MPALHVMSATLVYYYPNPKSDASVTRHSAHLLSFSCLCSGTRSPDTFIANVSRLCSLGRKVPAPGTCTPSRRESSSRCINLIATTILQMKMGCVPATGNRHSWCTNFFTLLLQNLCGPNFHPPEQLTITNSRRSSVPELIVVDQVPKAEGPRISVKVAEAA
ncbi:hypothetical protein AB1N83_009221 [Pleurotus pulmonarius]